mmetsp:Transcript_26340/g.35166  ORF Transcript_26340/g.35166 Transcript_26340/m.35166 type:complete len:127 (+) Transcript_26340:669-1049(+)
MLGRKGPVFGKTRAPKEGGSRGRNGDGGKQKKEKQGGGFLGDLFGGAKNPFGRRGLMGTIAHDAKAAIKKTRGVAQNMTKTVAQNVTKTVAQNLPNVKKILPKAEPKKKEPKQKEPRFDEKCDMRC